MCDPNGAWEMAKPDVLAQLNQAKEALRGLADILEAVVTGKQATTTTQAISLMLDAKDLCEASAWCKMHMKRVLAGEEE